MTDSRAVPFFYSVFIYLCGLFLFLEWLYPLKIVTDTSDITVFIIFTVFCFLLSLFQVKWWIAFTLKGAGLLFIVHALYGRTPFFSVIWLEELWVEAAFNMEAFFSRDWYLMTDMFRSMLLLGLIWLMSYLVYYWFVEAKRIFLFILLTFIYITILDTFTGYQAEMAVIRTFILAFVALGLTNVMKKTEQESLRLSWLKHLPAWIIPLAVVVSVSAIIGYAAPKVGPQWPDPVPYIKKAGMSEDEKNKDAEIKKAGYGEDDSRLGGSFEQDHTPVFRAVVDSEHYWRVETKDIYTGKGWIQSKEPAYETQMKDNIMLRTFSDNTDTISKRAEIDFQGNNPMEKLIYPYGIREVHTEINTQLRLNRETEAIETKVAGETVRLDNYAMTYEEPQFSVKELQKATAQDPQRIKDQYTVLPDKLPQQVYELAEEVAASKMTRYEKALAIEQYFNRNGFVYQTENIPVPKEEEDYVDQFLFDTKRGYCDNFSTSMVVMLRTLDIPARWVKGFTSGEKIGEVEDGQDEMDIYEITNANAHSWVEVYFPEIGWVPFEPTQGFNNLADFYSETPTDNEPDEEENEPESNDEEEEEKEQEKPTDSKNSAAWKYIIAGIIVSSLISIIIYRTRFRWQTLLLTKKLEHNNNVKTYEQAYLHLLNVLRVKAVAKRPDQTLREYAKIIDQKYGTNEMELLTNYYEQMLYNDKLKNINGETFFHVWKRLMKQIFS
ncbi:transglutaminase TgpA family protein [Virgibacillus sp. W0181]|uniref:transglutaminase TgpA family protein n=1 Tax=Virgibacillus sp. W0181 TaxID=3391581 RepID=UPI003F475019